MKLPILRPRLTFDILLITVLSLSFFNFLLHKQSSLMYQNLEEEMGLYNVKKAKHLANNTYKSFQKSLSSPSPQEIKNTLQQYDDLPFFTLNFIYKDEDGNLKSVRGNTQKKDILGAAYSYPVRYGGRVIGVLLVYDFEQEHEKRFKEYSDLMNLTRFFYSGFIFLLFILFVGVEDRAIHDGLTRLYTHKYFKDSLKRAVTGSAKSKHPIALIMCDIDHFKQFNDKFGHLAGDQVLRTISEVFTKNTRSSDVVARYGGEEISILLQGEEALSRQTSLAIAKRLKTEVENAKIKLEDKTLGVTVSMGVSFHDSASSGCTPEMLIKQADKALYESKRTGRNKITECVPRTGQLVECP